MTEQIEALVDKELLKWARRNASLSTDIVARKIGVNKENLESWEAGETRPTIPQLRKLANAYKRPIAVFYLPEPPKDFAPLRDYRRFAGTARSVLSPALQLEIRLAYDRRETALELYHDLEYTPIEPPPKVRISDEPEALALKTRALLGINHDIQVKFYDNHKAFNWWQTAVEETGVLVCRVSSVNLSEMRGFSIGEIPFPVVVINNNDSPAGRIFTMLHEFIHIMLRHRGLCDLREGTEGTYGKQRTEVFCNRVAGAILLPKDDLLLENAVSRNEPGTEWPDSDIRELANKYKVSREVVVRRLLILERITPDFYQKKRRQFEQEYATIKNRAHQKEGFAPPHRIAIMNAGVSFTNLVLIGYHNRLITGSDLSDFLNIRLKHIKEIEQEVPRVRWSKLGQESEVQH